MDLSIQAVRVIFQTVTGSDAEFIEPLNQGMTSRAWRVSHNEVDYVVRMALPNSGRSISYRSECEIYKQLKPLPVPEPLATYKDQVIDKISIPWAITRMVKGKAIKSGALAVQCAHDLGRALTTIHALPVRAYGRLEEGGDGICGRQKTALLGIIERWCFSVLWPFDGSSLATNTGYHQFSVLAERIGRYKNAIELIGQDKEVVLVHSDLHGEHIFVKDQRLTGLIDFGAAFIGVAEWEFGRLGFQLGWPDTLLVLETYGGGMQDRHFVVRAYLLGLVISLYKINRYIAEAAPVAKLNKALGFLDITLGLLESEEQ